MPRPESIQLPTGEAIPILYEDRSVLAVDKPRHWMLVPPTWQKTDWNLQVAITSSIRAGDFWARSRGLRALQFVHRLDTDTTGVLLFVKSPNAVRAYSALFESRKVEKVYLAVVGQPPKASSWRSRSAIGPVPGRWGKMQVDARHGKPAETQFQLVTGTQNRWLVEARPTTGRTHQIRLHLAEAGCPVIGDKLYGNSTQDRVPLGLRSIYLAYADPFTRRWVRIVAPFETFLKEYDFPEAKEIVKKKIEVLLNERRDRGIKSRRSD